MDPKRSGVAFLDGTGTTPGSEQCKCGIDCEFPCWQRIGIAEACGACGCPPLPEEEMVLADVQRELPDA